MAKNIKQDIIFQIFTNQHGYVLVVMPDQKAYAMQAYANVFSLYQDIKNGAPVIPINAMVENIFLQYEADARKAGHHETRIAWRATYLADKSDIVSRIQNKIMKNRRSIIQFLENAY